MHLLFARTDAHTHTDIYICTWMCIYDIHVYVYYDLNVTRGSLDEPHPFFHNNVP